MENLQGYLEPEKLGKLLVKKSLFLRLGIMDYYSLKDIEKLIIAYESALTPNKAGKIAAIDKLSLEQGLKDYGIFGTEAQEEFEKAFIEEANKTGKRRI